MQSDSQRKANVDGAIDLDDSNNDNDENEVTYEYPTSTAVYRKLMTYILY